MNEKHKAMLSLAAQNLNLSGTENLDVADLLKKLEQPALMVADASSTTPEQGAEDFEKLISDLGSIFLSLTPAAPRN